MLSGVVVMLVSRFDGRSGHLWPVRGIGLIAMRNLALEALDVSPVRNRVMCCIMSDWGITELRIRKVLHVSPLL